MSCARTCRCFLANLLPLLEFANGELNLGCALEKLRKNPD